MPNELLQVIIDSLSSSIIDLRSFDALKSTRTIGCVLYAGDCLLFNLDFDKRLNDHRDPTVSNKNWWLRDRKRKEGGEEKLKW